MALALPRLTARTPLPVASTAAESLAGPSVCLTHPRASFPLQLESAAKKRERTTSDPRTTEQKQEKKRLKTSKKPKDPDLPEKDFTPYDYSKSDFKAFAGEAGTGAL